jgi:excisionase family DNA binding protein
MAKSIKPTPLNRMKHGNPTWLTTGQTAHRCAVTPATVLNWIRSGRLEAIRTPGGHYRVKLEKLQPLLQQQKTPNLDMGGHTRQAPLRCWEYLSEGGTTREECLTCVVHRVRASWCFQIATLGIDSGHAKRFCPTSCDDCAYYRRVSGLPTNVLIVSSDPDILHGIEGQESEDIVLRFARNSYEASAAVETFLPAFAIVDMENSAARENNLLESLGRDPRLPGLKTVVAVRQGRSKRKWKLNGNPFISGRIEKPIDLTQIRAVIESFPVECV